MIMNSKRVKKNCERCRAITVNGRCDLGYNNSGELIPGLGIRRIKPQEPCPKPLTIEDLFRSPRKGETLLL